MFKPEQVDDQSILREIAAGNLDAFDTFVDRYRDRLHRYLVSRGSLKCHTLAFHHRQKLRHRLPPLASAPANNR